MLICRKQNISQKHICLGELPLQPRQVSITVLPDFRPACLAALQAPGRLGTQPGILSDSLFCFVFFFPLSFETRGKRSWKKYKPALHAFFQLFSICFVGFFLIMMTLHSTSWFVTWESQNSFTPCWRLSCPGSETVFMPRWASFQSVSWRNGASIFSSSLFSKHLIASQSLWNSSAFLLCLLHLLLPAWSLIQRLHLPLIWLLDTRSCWSSWLTTGGFLGPRAPDLL